MTTTEPLAPQVVTVQFTRKAGHGSTLDETVETARLALGEVATGRITILDSYWLIDGERVTPSQLKEAKAKIVNQDDAEEPTGDVADE